MLLKLSGDLFSHCPFRGIFYILPNCNTSESLLYLFPIGICYFFPPSPRDVVEYSRRRDHFVQSPLPLIISRAVDSGNLVLELPLKLSCPVDSDARSMINRSAYREIHPDLIQFLCLSAKPIDLLGRVDAFVLPASGWAPCKMFRVLLAGGSSPECPIFLSDSAHYASVSWLWQIDKLIKARDLASFLIQPAVLNGFDIEPSAWFRRLFYAFHLSFP